MAKMMKVGLVGWRGMVGSVLVGRMQEERDFDHVRTTLFSTSQAGQAAIALPNTEPVVADAGDVAALSAMDVLISCQGGDYTTAMHPKLRASGRLTRGGAGRGGGSALPVTARWFDSRATPCLSCPSIPE